MNSSSNKYRSPKNKTSLCGGGGTNTKELFDIRDSLLDIKKSLFDKSSNSYERLINLITVLIGGGIIIWLFIISNHLDNISSGLELLEKKIGVKNV